MKFTFTTLLTLFSIAPSVLSTSCEGSCCSNNAKCVNDPNATYLSFTHTNKSLNFSITKYSPALLRADTGFLCTEVCDREKCRASQNTRWVEQNANLSTGIGETFYFTGGRYKGSLKGWRYCETDKYIVYCDSNFQNCESHLTS